MVVPSSSSTKRSSPPHADEEHEAPVAPKAPARAAPSARLQDNLPRWIIMPAETGAGGPTACPQARAIRFPTALTPVLAASLGELSDPSVVAALNPAARRGYGALAVDWRQRRLAPGLSRLTSRRSR